MVFHETLSCSVPSPIHRAGFSPQPPFLRAFQEGWVASGLVAYHHNVSSQRRPCSSLPLLQQDWMTTVFSVDGIEAILTSLRGSQGLRAQPTCPSDRLCSSSTSPAPHKESSAPESTHLERGPQHVWPALHLPLWKRCLCTPEGGRK